MSNERESIIKFIIITPVSPVLSNTLLKVGKKKLINNNSFITVSYFILKNILPLFISYVTHKTF
ncbi:hypothetical protein THF1D04_40154 [Vibrio owensii]|uniref:Uncharacterized protein n=1 Tax=Vibrio owensii TaxID=696485 RepID=A0AAU9Q8C6_9VIBR|nr:hypothetical protein THF1D04_40154 [Vibrio owensii]